MKKITIPYRPTKLCREVIHPNLEKHRFSVIVAHRRFGKTVLAVNHKIKMAVKNNKRAPMYAYIAPFRNQAKQIAWNYLKFYTHVIPGVKVNESELYIELPTKHKGSNGARIYVMGADHPDALRGTYWDGVILDEYAQMKPELWNEIIRPAIADREGWAIFIGTPKGQNQFYEMYQRACKDPDWYCALYRADESGLFDEGGRYGPKELESMKKDMTEEAIRQELYCDFTASASNILITIDLVTKAVNRVPDRSTLEAAPKVMGIDVARFGDDRSVICKRQGLVMYQPQKYTGLNNMELASVIVNEIENWKPDAVFIDSGNAGGVIDRVRQLGYEAIEVPFSSSPIDQRYLNKRAEMYFSLKAWLEAGGCLPNDPDLKTELTVAEYSYTTGKNLIKIEPKEKIKEKLGRSPDLADAAILTLAMPVVSKEARAMAGDYCNTEYDPF